MPGWIAYVLRAGIGLIYCEPDSGWKPVEDDGLWLGPVPMPGTSTALDMDAPVVLRATQQPEEIAVIVYTIGDASVGIAGTEIRTTIPSDLWFSLSASERQEMAGNILSAIGPWMDERARVRVDDGVEVWP
jgi:hypothetical protein